MNYFKYLSGCDNYCSSITAECCVKTAQKCPQTPQLARDQTRFVLGQFPFSDHELTNSSEI